MKISLRCHFSHLSVAVLLVSLMCASASAAQKVKLFLIAGQSNAVGCGEKTALPAILQQPQKNVRFFGIPDAQTKWWVPLSLSMGGCCCDFGPEITFGHDLAAGLSADSVYIMKGGKGATYLGCEWASPSSSTFDCGDPGTLYRMYIDTLRKGISLLGSAYEVEIAGMLWMQGESDAGEEGTAGAYETYLANFIKDIRKELAVPAMPFVIAMIDSTPDWPYAATVRQAQRNVAAAIANVGIFDTRGFPKSRIEDGGWGSGHYNGSGLMALGSDAAAVMQRLLVNPAAGALAQPSDLVAATLASGKVKLTWRDNSTTETGFTVERKTGSGAYTAMGTTPSGTTIFASYADNSAVASTSYSYRVKANTASTSSAYSNEALVFPLGIGTGLKAQYFSDTTYQTSALSRVDTVVNFNWKGVTPGSGLSSRFSVRWTGFVVPRYTENYTFFVNSDMMGKVWINDQLIVDPAKYAFGPGQPYTPIHGGSVQMTAGQLYSIKIDYRVTTPAEAHAQLYWKTPVSQQWQIVPKSQLYQEAPIVVAGDTRLGQSERAGIPVATMVGKDGSIKITGQNATQRSTVVVSDMQGRTLAKAYVNGQASFDLGVVGSGAFFVSVRNKMGIVTRKIVIQH